MRSGSFLAGLAVLAGSAAAADLPPAFDAAQAERGRALYDDKCADCHGSQQQGSPGGPAVSGDPFRAKWRLQTAEALFGYIQFRMPAAAPGTLTDAETADLTAFLLKANGATAGAPAADRARLTKLKLADVLAPAKEPPPETTTPAAQGPVDAYGAAQLAARTARMAKLAPVTEAMLRRPPDGAWLNWRRTDDAHGFSPLRQISRDTVGGLQGAWSWSLPAGLNQVTPLAHDGILFVASGGKVQALDAVTGDLLWEYGRVNTAMRVRGLALYGDSLFFARSDTNLVALDMRTGAVRWDKALAQPGERLRMTAAPLVARGLVIQGMSGCSEPHPGGCFIVALKADTGEEAWRFNTIARPGQPGGDSWNGAPLEERFGGSVWITGSYDPELDLLFFGTGQTYKTATLLQGGDGRPGSNDGLYTDSTLALRPATGELVWHFQHMKREVWDLDWAFERTLATLTVDGRPRRTVTASSKLGLFDTLDAATGRYLGSYDMGQQNLVASIDPATGDKRIAPDFAPQPGVSRIVCPSALGGRDWPATAFNPATRILYVPWNEACMDFAWVPGAPMDMKLVTRARPDSDGMIGRVQAIDLQNRRTLWTVRRRAPESSAILATAGGLIFEGSRDRWFRASDERTGEVLWQTRLNAPPSSYPISYSVDGVQYVAVTAGGGNYLDVNIGALAPEIAVPAGATTLWVFRLGPAPARQASSRP